MGETQLSVIGPAPAASAPSRPDPDGGVSFHEVLSALNPLQYLPVVGTIYRAATGDIIPEPLRIMGSLVASGLMGGPVGIITGIASLALQKITGIDLDAVGASVLHSIGIGGEPDAPPVRTATPAAADMPAAPEPEPVRTAWTSAQLAAYGMGDGISQAQDVTADMLNGMELANIGRAMAAYGKMAA
jgi:hypothetical protein